MQISLGLPPWHDSSKIVSGKPGAVHYLRHFAGDQDDLNSVLANEPFPVMHSPISGTTIAQLFATAGSGAAFFALFPHPDLGQIATYFLVVGGTKIVFGAADGVGYALKHGLSHTLLKWMGAPTEIVDAEEKRAKTRRARANAMRKSDDDEHQAQA